jgi:RsiW-degrading membrane proteinase PrsW (M82 family)
MKRVVTMRPPYLFSLAAGGAGIAVIAWALFAGPQAPPITLFVAAASVPSAVLAAVWGRLGGRFPWRALLLGALIGPIVAILAYPLVAAFAVAFLLGFSDSGRQLIDALRVDPRLTTALASPWVLLLLVDLATVAPITEEFAKALGAVIARPKSRREAFLFGVAAGVAFAIIENILYATLGFAFGSPWPAITVGRSMGAAVHPLACGLVMLGWWEWRQTQSVGALLKGYLSAVGIHALWNGSLLVVGIVETVLTVGGTAPAPLAPIGLTYAAMLGIVLAALLRIVTTSVAEDHPAFEAISFRTARPVAVWTVLSASLLVPVAVLVLAFPAFYRG